MISAVSTIRQSSNSSNQNKEIEMSNMKQVNQELISVIIPVYNMEKYLVRCLDSVINNTYANLEIICVNDGSSDHSLQILKRYQKNDPRILIINQENMGISAARNAGLALAKGGWIAFIDSDDWVHKQYFEILLFFGKKTDVDIIIGGTQIISEDTLTNQLINTAELQSESFSATELKKMHLEYTRVWGRLFKFTCLKDHLFVPGLRYLEDSIFNVMLYDTTTRIGYLNFPLYYYCLQENSLIHSTQVLPQLSNISIAINYSKENWYRFSDYQRSQIAERLYKLVLSARFMAEGTIEYREAKKNASDLFDAIKDMNKSIPLKKRIMFGVFREYPILYKAYRLYDDPTLKDHLRKKRQQQG